MILDGMSQDCKDALVLLSTSTGRTIRWVQERLFGENSGRDKYHRTRVVLHALFECGYATRSVRQDDWGGPIMLWYKAEVE